jgi:adenine specific DNA methylase Mod
MKDEGFIQLTEPGINKEMSELHSMVNPEFRLNNKEDGEHLIKAMQVLFESTYKTYKKFKLNPTSCKMDRFSP